MASYELPVSNTKDALGAIVDTGDTQDQIDRQFSLNGVEGDAVVILSSQDDFNTDAQIVTSVTPGTPKIVPTIARWYRTARSGVGNPASPAVKSCWMGDAVANAAGGTPTGGAANVVTYQEGGTPNPALGIYSTFATALAAARAMAQANPTIVIDPTHGQPVIPSAIPTYNVLGMRLAGLAGIATQLNVANGAHLGFIGGTLTLAEGLVLNFQTTSGPAVLISAAGQSTYLVCEGVTPRGGSLGPGAGLTVDASATVTPIHVTNGALFVQCDTHGVLFNSSGSCELFQVDTPGALALEMDALSILGANTLSSTNAIVAVDELSTTASISRTQPALTSVSAGWGSYQLLGAVASGLANAITILTAHSQRIPPGDSLTADSAGNFGRGQVQQADYRIANCAISFVGDAGNTNGQTATLQIYVNGTIVTFTPALATLPVTAGRQDLAFNLGEQALTGVAGDVIALGIGLSADLQVGLTNIMAAVGP